MLCRDTLTLKIPWINYQERPRCVVVKHPLRRLGSSMEIELKLASN